MFVSADEKFGEELVLEDVPPAADEPDDPIELEPEEDDGVLDDEDGELVEDDGLADEPLEDFDVSFATASDDSAKSTAAVMMLRVLGMDGAF